MEKNKNWWDGLTDDDILWLKNNKVPYGLNSVFLKKLFNKIPREDLLYYNGNSRGWIVAVSEFRCDSNTYRLRSDWERPEPEVEDDEKSLELNANMVKRCCESMLENLPRSNVRLYINFKIIKDDDEQKEG